MNFGDIFYDKTTGSGLSDYYTSSLLSPALTSKTTTAATQTAADTFNFSDMFTGKNLGSSLAGIGAVLGAIGGIWGSMNQQKAYDEAMRMERQRIADLKANHDRTQKVFTDAWG